MLAAVLLAVLAAGAQDAPRAAPAAVQAAPDAAALQAEFEALRLEYAKAQSDYWKDIKPDANGVLTLTPEQRDKQPDKLYGSRFLELGRRAGKTEAGAHALVAALQTQQPPDVQQQVIDLLMANFLDSPALEEAVPEFGSMRFGRGSDVAETLLRRVLAGTTHDSVKAAASFELAQVLMDPVYTFGPQGFSEAPRTDTGPAHALLVEVRDHYKDTRAASQAAGFLFELEHLQVGMTAPDVTATDADGHSFKLSDYRGKVVLLDFWGFW